MHDRKIIFYGMGSHAQSVLSHYPVSVNQIEAIIDNSPEKLRRLLQGSGIQVYTWDEFVSRNISTDCQIVISSKFYRKEIEEQILTSTLFQPNQVVYIDDWCKANVGG